MVGRVEVLQPFVNVAAAAFEEFAQGPDCQRVVRHVFSTLQHASIQGPADGSQLPVCSHLQRALTVETTHTTLRVLIEQFAAIEPLLHWRRRPTYDASTASNNFVQGHANAMIIGPGGLEDRGDVWLGVSLLA